MAQRKSERILMMGSMTTNGQRKSEPKRKKTASSSEAAAITPAKRKSEGILMMGSSTTKGQRKSEPKKKKTASSSEVAAITPAKVSHAPNDDGGEPSNKQIIDALACIVEKVDVPFPVTREFLLGILSDLGKQFNRDFTKRRDVKIMVTTATIKDVGDWWKGLY